MVKDDWPRLHIWQDRDTSTGLAGIVPPGLTRFILNQDI
jgi:hypothetical protein